jgi:signal transduction histidine kinase
MLIDDLRTNFLTGALNDTQLAELAAAGEEVAFGPGEELFHEGDQAENLWILLEGHVELVRRFNNDANVLFTMTTPGQWAGGWQAWDGAERGTGSRSLDPRLHPSHRLTGYAVTAGRMFRVPSEALGRLAGEWFPFGKHLIMGLYQNVRSIEAAAHQRESLVALGTLAAGLAHEINNPASAAVRAVVSLQETVDAVIGELAQYTLPAEQYTALDQLRRELVQRPAHDRGALDDMDREDAAISWLGRRGVDRPWELAPGLTSAGADVEWLERVEQALGDDPLEPGLRWATTAITAGALLSELADTTNRISNLVEAVKTYSQMDRASLQHIDVHSGLDSTLTMLANKLVEIEVQRDFDAGLPHIDAYAAELNQVWTNLIDNAAEAMSGHGTLRLTTRVDRGAVVVDVSDTGHGMSPEVQTRAFEPFFTTKDVGSGVGLGLDMARRVVVEHHGGEISFDSSDAGTTVRVRLPVSRGSVDDGLVRE